MKRLINIMIVLAVGTGMFAGCDETRTTYDGPSFVMFSDTMSICPAMKNGKDFPVHVVTLRASDYDRTYSVEIMAGASNAVYGYHYKLDKQSVTIPAGQTSATVNVRPVYENIENTDSLGFQLNLLSALGDEWSEEGSTTKIILQKVCPFDIHDFVGYYRVTSAFLNTVTGNYNRISTVEMVDGEENTLLLKGFYQDQDVISGENYDLKITFDGSDPLNPTFKVQEDQIIGDARTFLNPPYGDGKLRVSEVPSMAPTFDICRKRASIPLLLYIKITGNNAYVGGWDNIVEWIEDYEAE